MITSVILACLLSCLFPHDLALVSKQPLYIGSISPLTGSSKWWGRGIPLAAQMAFDTINKDPHILPDYELKLISNNSKGQTGRGIRILYDYLTNRKILLVLGPSRSNVATAVADTAKYWKLIQVSASATSGGLSSRKTYPYFLRTVPSFSAISTAFVTLAKKFGWKRVSILYYYREMQTKVYNRPLAARGMQLNLKGKTKECQLQRTKSLLSCCPNSAAFRRAAKGLLLGA